MPGRDVRGEAMNGRAIVNGMDGTTGDEGHE